MGEDKLRPDADGMNAGGDASLAQAPAQVPAEASANAAVEAAEEHSDELFEAAAEQPQSDLSLADVERRRFRPAAWAGFFVLVLAAIVLPYWAGRDLAMNHTALAMEYMGRVEPRGVALVAWAVTMFAFTGLGMAVVQTRTWLWRFVFVVGLAAEQFIAGVCLLRSNFWYATYVVYGKNAQAANAGDLGVIAAALGVAVFAVLFVAILVLIHKDSPLNVLTHSWAAFSLFFAVELAALLIVLFGGLLTTV